MFDGLRAGVARIFNLRQTAPDRRNGLNYFNIGPVVAGVRLYEPEDALKIAAVYRCVNLIADSIAQLPWGVLERKEGKRTPLDDHRVTWMLRSEANPEQTAFVAKRTMVSHLLLGGNMYGEIERDPIGRAVNLWPLHFSRCEAVRNEDNGRLQFAVRQGNGSVVRIEARDMYHVPGFSTDGIRGYSVLEVGMQSLATSAALDQFAGRYFANGMQLSGIVTSPEKWGEETRANFMNFLEKFAGSKNAFKVMPLDGGMDFKPITSTPEQGQFLDARKFSVVDVCRWFGVPPHMAFDLDRATFSNIEHQDLAFVKYGLIPRVMPMEQEADRKLVTSNRAGLYTKMNLNAFLRGDSVSRMNYFRGMRDMGAMNVNQIREREDMDGIGPAGDVYTSSVQYQKPDGADDAPPVDNDTTPTPPQQRGARVNGH